MSHRRCMIHFIRNSQRGLHTLCEQSKRVNEYSSCSVSVPRTGTAIILKLATSVARWPHMRDYSDKHCHYPIGCTRGSPRRGRGGGGAGHQWMASLRQSQEANMDSSAFEVHSMGICFQLMVTFLSIHQAGENRQSFVFVSTEVWTQGLTLAGTLLLEKRQLYYYNLPTY
jgi:hypothetical protein